MLLQNWWFTTLLGRGTPQQAPLQADIEADVLIIGGGAAGLAAALRLMGSGLKIALLERNICGGSSTGKSAGFLTPDSELELSQLIRRFGPEGARQLWEVPTKGIEIMKSAIDRYELACDFVPQDSLFLGNGAAGWNDVLEESASRERLGYVQKLYAADEVPAILGSRAYSGGIRYPGTYGIDALQYAQGVKQVLLRGGVAVYEASEVRRIEDHRALTHLGSVKAGAIIFCADKPKPGLTPFSRNVYHAQTFLSISEPLTDREVAAMFPAGQLQCWDSDLVYCYFRLTGDQRLLLGGGSMLTTFAQHDTTEPDVIVQVIEKFKAKFPMLRDVEFIQYWPGRIDCTRDLLPTVGRDPEHPWVHFVLGCVGLPWATFCGDFAARHILNDDSEDKRYYHYFRADRPFLLPLWSEKIIGKQLVFSLNTGWSKYYQVDEPTASPEPPKAPV